MLSDFLALSSELCGFSEFTLQGTGYADGYLATVRGMVGDECMGELLRAYRELGAQTPETRDRALRATILSHEKLGPVARNIIKLWYSATWFELPPEWHREFQTQQDDRRFNPFTYAYPEGLLGPAVGAHMQGAKPTGYGSWAQAPRLLEFNGDPMLRKHD